MEVKTDTKEKFHVISVNCDHLSVNMTEELSHQLQRYLKEPIKNMVLNLSALQSMDEEGAEALVKLQQVFYENNASFVICELKPELETWLDEKDLLELINITPTESEAWDIVQMEEMERELLGDEDKE